MIARVGIVAKRGLVAAAPHLGSLIDWLAGRGLSVTLDADTAALLDREGGFAVVGRDELPSAIDTSCCECAGL